MKITIPQTKPRIAQHAVLFNREMPFQPKTEQRKNTYQRKPKYKKLTDWD